MTERPNKLRYVRRLRDLTQEELAERAQLSTATVSDLERGRYRPGLDTALALARVLDWPAEDLFVPSESGDAPDEMAPGGSTEPQDGRDDRIAANRPVGNRAAEDGVVA